MALKITHSQLHGTNKYVWCLPTPFAVCLFHHISFLLENFNIGELLTHTSSLLWSWWNFIFHHWIGWCVIGNQSRQTCRLLRERFHVVICMPKSCNFFILMGDTKIHIHNIDLNVIFDADIYTYLWRYQSLVSDGYMHQWQEILPLRFKHDTWICGGQKTSNKN